jgi:UDP-N-acetylglucosamine 2-epimerase (non-hydrolysing)
MKLKDAKLLLPFILSYARPVFSWIIILFGSVSIAKVFGLGKALEWVVKLILGLFGSELQLEKDLLIREGPVDVYQVLVPVILIVGGVISLNFWKIVGWFDANKRNRISVYLYVVEILKSVDDSVKGVEAWCYIRGFIGLFKFLKIPNRNQEVILINGALSASYFGEILAYNEFIGVVGKSIKSKYLASLSFQIAKYYLPSSGKVLDVSDRRQIYSELGRILEKEKNPFIKAVCLNYMGLLKKHNIRVSGDLDVVEKEDVQKAISHFKEARNIILKCDKDRRMSVWTGYICRNLGNMQLRIGEKSEGLKNLMISHDSWEGVVEKTSSFSQVTKNIFFNELCFVRMDIMGEKVLEAHQRWLKEIEEYLGGAKSLASTEVVRGRFGQFGRNKKFLFVMGTRPEFIKAQPVINEMLKSQKDVSWVNTAQHFSKSLSDQVLNDLNLIDPIRVLPQFHEFERVGRWVTELEALISQHKYTDVLVVGDTDSALAGALAAVRQKISLSHIEAGLRSKNDNMKEERNRFIIDHLSEKLFITEDAAKKNLEEEGVSGKLFVVGNILSDSLLAIPKEEREKEIHRDVLVTLHRDENVYSEDNLNNIVDALIYLKNKCSIKFIAHPKVERMLKDSKKFERLVQSGVRMMKPVPHRDFVRELRNATLIITDSGGVQEEAAIEGVNCITIRSETERPSTLLCGANIVIDPREADLGNKISKISFLHRRTVPPLWDGEVAKRIVQEI